MGKFYCPYGGVVSYKLEMLNFKIKHFDFHLAPKFIIYVVTFFIMLKLI